MALANRADSRALPRVVALTALPVDSVENASYDLDYTNGKLTQVDKVVGGATYRLTLTYSTTTGLLDTVSTWSAV